VHMRIDTLGQVNGQVAELKAQKSTAETAGGFFDILESMANKPESFEKSADSMIVAARFSQLQMLQSLFVDEDAEEDDLFAGWAEMNTLNLLPTQKSQIIDQYARAGGEGLTSAGNDRQYIDNMIDKVAGELSLSPDLVRSVVKAESDYRADAVSPVGAQGLMQLMPGTARELGVEDSFDIGQNLTGGSRYLKQLLDKYDGDLDHALAAYNWGQGNVDRHGLAEMPRETRDYLSKIKNMLDAQES